MQKIFEIKQFLKKSYKLLLILVLLIGTGAVVAISQFQTQNDVYKKAKNTRASEIKQIYFVSLNGNDSNQGTEQSPFKSFKKAVSMLTPGSELQIEDGIYTEPLVLTESGNNGEPIIIRAKNSNKVTLDAQYTNDESKPPLNIPTKSSFITIRGLNVTRSTFECVLISGTNILMDSMDVYNCRKFGYRVKGSYITIENSQCRDSVTENEGGHNTTGGWGSCLKTAPYSHHLTIRNNHIFNNWGEGLILGQSADSSAYGNLVHDNFSQNIYIGNAYNIDVYKNMTYSTDAVYYRAKSPANCITTSEEDISQEWGARLKNIRVFNNIGYGCKTGLGYTYSEISGNGCENCLFAFNTMVKTGGVKIIPGVKNSVTIMNNIIIGGELPDPSSSISLSHNLLRDPQFLTEPGTDPSTFRLGSTSPARGGGIGIPEIIDDFEGKSRTTTSNTSPDIGAIAFSGEPISHAYTPPSSTAPTSKPNPTRASVPTQEELMVPVTQIPITAPPATTPSSVSLVEISKGSVQVDGAPFVTTSTDISASTKNQLYITAVSTKANVEVGRISGLGLNWQRVAAQCSGRSNVRTDVWWAYGTVSPGRVTAHFLQSSKLKAAVIVVSSYTGAAPAPIGSVVTQNSIGIKDVSCKEGTDTKNYTSTISNTKSDSTLIGVIGLRQYAHFPKSGITQLVETHTNRGNGEDAGLALISMPMSQVGSYPVSGNFISKTDYAFIGVEVLSQ